VAAWLKRLTSLLGLDEIEADPRLRMICGALLYYFHMTFFDWWRSASALSTKGTESANYVPFFLFEGQRWSIFLNHEQTKVYLYVLGMLALLALFFLFYERRPTTSVVLLVFLWLNKVFFYLHDLRLFANFHHLHLIYTLAFLLAPSPYKLFFFRITLVVSYLMSGIIKLTPSWLLGEYFNSTPGKLPLLPDAAWFVTLAQQGIIVLELVLVWAWFAPYRWLRSGCWYLYIFFHLYSGLLVGFKYTSLMMPLVVAAFLDFSHPIQYGYRWQRNHWRIWLFEALLLAGSVYHLFIPGDTRLTHEGKYFGVFMFDANRAVEFQSTIVKGDQRFVLQIRRPWRNGAILETGWLEPQEDLEVQVEVYRHDELIKRYTPKGAVRDSSEQMVFNPKMLSSAQVRTFGDPYLYYFFAKEICARYRPDSISLTLWEQLDGHLYRAKLVDIPEFSPEAYPYSGWRHNPWIQIPGPEAPSSYRWW
jgi:hypothetical protein